MSLLDQLLFLPERASTFAEQVDQLHYFVVLTTIVASTAVGVTALLLFVRFRQRTVGQQTVPVHPPIWLEALFVVVPLAFFLVWFGIGYRDYLLLSTPPKDAMDVYVMGKQWMWQFAYPDGPSSVEVLRVPKGRPVRLLLTSRDVIHSFYVSQFRIKQDALPGRYTQTWFTATRAGSFEVLCTEYCGVDHSIMRGEVLVLEPEEFDRWWQGQRRGLFARGDYPASREAEESSMVGQGRRLAMELGCLRCHSLDGTPHIGPSWKDLYGREEKLESGGRVKVDEAYLTRSMMDPLAEVVAGFKPVMPSFRGRVEPAQAAALVEFIKSLRSEPFAQELPRGER
ncbi:MAG: cytochrome c oxidase subunit II [Myxococcales bacterium]|nr:cytochrome c oxidase subunit II [Myxococcales bacterium]